MRKAQNISVYESYEAYEDSEFKLYLKLKETKSLVDLNLKNNFNTPEVISNLRSLVNSTNSYISIHEKSSLWRIPLLKSVVDYITKIFNIFGLVSDINDFGFTTGIEDGGGEELLGHVLDAFTKFRDNVRILAKKKEKNYAKMLELCDEIRDKDLVELGIKVEDKSSSSSIWKMVDKETLKREIEEKKREAEVRKLKKEKQKQLLEKKRLEKERLAKIPPDIYFLNMRDEKNILKYSQFDEHGIPTHFTNENEEIKKKQRKKLTKIYNNQLKLHQKFLKKQQNQTQ